MLCGYVKFVLMIEYFHEDGFERGFFGEVLPQVPAGGRDLGAPVERGNIACDARGGFALRGDAEGDPGPLQQDAFGAFAGVRG